MLRQLTNSPKSRHQLAAKLAEREVPEDVAKAVLDRFEEVQLIDDAEFARLWVRSRSRNKSLARGALRRELTEKGIPKELTEDALALLDDADERDSAEELVRRKLRSIQPAKDRVERDKQQRRLLSMLARKGYSSGLAFEVVNQELTASAAES